MFEYFDPPADEVLDRHNFHLSGTRFVKPASLLGDPLLIPRVVVEIEPSPPQTLRLEHLFGRGQSRPALAGCAALPRAGRPWCLANPHILDRAAGHGDRGGFRSARPEPYRPNPQEVQAFSAPGRVAIQHSEHLEHQFGILEIGSIPLLGGFLVEGHPAERRQCEGILVSDFWGDYNAVCCAPRQMCLVHLVRDLKHVEKYRSAGQGWPAFTKKLRGLLGDGVRLWRERGELPAENYRCAAQPAARAIARIGRGAL